MNKNQGNRKSFNPLNLSFLDIMSCGLGAVILVFLILKHGESISPEESNRISQDITATNSQINLAKEELEKVINEIEQTSNEIIQVKSQTRIISAVIEEELANQRLSDQEIQDLQEDLEQLEDRNIDLIENYDEGEKMYLAGLEVKGDRIVFLLDNSASMMDEKLINIIRKSLLNDTKKRDSEKWVKSKLSAKWLLNRIPEKSIYSFLTFNENVELRTNAVWNDGSDENSIQQLMQSIEEITPEGGTNLEKALRYVKKMKPMPDAVYLITDGLPTIGEEVEKITTSIFNRCFRSSQKKKQKISSECRHALFQKAKEDYLKGRKIKTSTILLPLEGDVRAASDYWNLSIQSGGLLISPSPDWP